MSSRKFSELPPIEQLAIKQALFNRLGEDVSTKSPTSLRHEMDEQIVANYHAMGAKSYDLNVNGQKVGTYSVKVSNGKPQETRRRLVVRDPAMLSQFIQRNAKESLEGDEESYAELYAEAMSQNFAEFVLEYHGELPDGCAVVTDTIPEQPPAVTGTTMRIDAEKVATALDGYLPMTVAGLIGGGDA